MYPIENTKLRVCASFLREKRNLRVIRNCRLILLEHILPTTESLIYLLAEAGADIHTIVAKPYSVDHNVLERLKQYNFSILQNKSYEELETTNVLDDLLSNAVRKSQQDGRKILIFEVGGYFARPLTRVRKSKSEYFVGVVEDTTFGHNRYFDEIERINVPVISVDRSRLKEIEAHFVGRDAVSALEMVMRRIGESITGRHVVVIGYGMIGKNVARCLDAADLNVSVYDIRDHRNLKAFMMGFNVHKKAELLRKADIVFAATGWSAYRRAQRQPAVSKDEILERLKNNAMLVSVGSKDNEFDMKRLKELATSKKAIGNDVIKYTLPSNNNVLVVKDGTAVNFLLPSIPTEILDLVFAEVLLSGILLMKNPSEYNLGHVHQIDQKYWNYIAKDWLRFVNR